MRFLSSTCCLVAAAALVAAAPAVAQGPLLDAFPLDPATRTTTTGAPAPAPAAPIPAARPAAADLTAPLTIGLGVVGALAAAVAVASLARRRRRAAGAPAEGRAPPAAPPAERIAGPPAVLPAPRRAPYEATTIDAGRDELDPALLERWAEAIGHGDPMRLLQARGLITRQGRLTVGALLLFGRAPQERLPHAVVRVRSPGADDVIAGGAIPEALATAAREIARRAPTEELPGEGGRMVTVEAIPHAAWTEALVNAVIHRTYRLEDEIVVDVAPDAIVVSSPGRFPGFADPDTPGGARRHARNPRIARVCSDLRLGQEAGAGLRRLAADMRAAGLAPPVHEHVPGGVVLTLPGRPPDGRPPGAGFPAAAREVLVALGAGDRHSIGELARAVGLPRSAVLRELRALQRRGLVAWVGRTPSDPHAYWRRSV